MARSAAYLVLSLFVIACGAEGPGTGPPLPTPHADTIAAVGSWLAASAEPVSLDVPAGGDSGLPRLRASVASARLIGLGEATHGTHEFQVMKDRVLQAIAREGNVSAFIIEGNLPEARALDRYVREGVGDPALLISLLYATPYNTQEMLDLVRALRAFDAPLPAERRVGFAGMDMSFSAAALDSVRAYAARSDAGGLGAFVSTAYGCFTPYDNGGKGGANLYDDAPDSVRTRCSAAARGVADTLARLAQSPSASDELAWAARYAQVVRQWEEYAALRRRDPNRATIARDRSLAENALWWLARGATSSRAIVSAHNYHVSRADSTMGQALARALGAAYLPIASTLDAGSFNAVAPGSPAFRPQAIAAAPAGSFEEGLRTAPAAPFFVDLRTGASTPAADTWLRSTHSLRLVGIGFDPAHAGNYDRPIVLSAAYDGILFTRQSTPTTLLPYIGP